MPGGLLGAISGILAGGILGFGAAEWIVLLDTFARSCFLFWCFVFVSVQDLVIQWHPLPTSLGLTGQGSFRCLCCLVGFLFFCGFCFFVFWFSLCVGPDLTSDSVMVPLHFRLPMRNIAIAST